MNNERINLKDFELIKFPKAKIKLLVFEEKKRPVKCSGYFDGIYKTKFGENKKTNISIHFRSLKYGRHYIGKSALPLKNIRFIINENIRVFYETIMTNEKMNKFFSNHFEYRNCKLLNLNKFDFLNYG